MNKEFVKFDKVDKSYDGKVLVVKDLQLDIEEGEFVTMLGPSGSGKTTFSKGFASGLGFSDEILSPTYSILNEYKFNGKSLYHFDLYRLKSVNEFLEIGGIEYLNDKKSISLIEWPELIKQMVSDNIIEIKFEHLSEQERKITVL